MWVDLINWKLIFKMHIFNYKTCEGYIWYIQGDFFKPDEFCFLIAPKANKLQSGIIAQKKQKFLGFYLIPVMTKSDHYFFCNLL